MRKSPCSDQGPFRKFKWQQQNSNPEPLSTQTNTEPFIKNCQMIELCCEYLSVRCIWVCVIIMFESEYTVYSLAECQGTPYSKEARYLNLNWEQGEPNPQPVSMLRNTEPFSETGQMIELCYEYLPVRYIWLYILILWGTNFRVNPHSVIWMNVKELLARSRCHISTLSDNNEIRIQNLLVHKRTHHHLAKLIKWLNSVVSNYL